MPYKDSLGMPAGYSGMAEYGPLEIEDVHPVLMEPVENPVADSGNYAMDPELEPQQQMPMPAPLQMGPEMGPYQEGGRPLSAMDIRQMMQQRLKDREAARYSSAMRFTDKNQKLNM